VYKTSSGSIEGEGEDISEVGLGHLAIDLHGADLSPKKVMLQVAHTLEVVRSSVPVNCQKVHAQLVDRRGRLNSHVERMHCHREPTGMSVYEMQGLLLRLGRTVKAATIHAKCRRCHSQSD
jgi:hypothetical protein